MRWHLLGLSWIVVLLASAGAAAEIRSREYKLMLDPEKFNAQDVGATVDRFWDEALSKIIATELDKRRNGKPRHKGSFEEAKQRQLVFRDTQRCLLNGHGYIFRERIKLKKGQPDRDSREVTLKFRTPDLFLAAAVPPAEGAKTKFEEDIAPLLVRKVDAAGKETAIFAQPPSMRSLFSVSISRDAERDDRFATLGALAELIADLGDRLAKAGVTAGDLGAKLVEGDTFRESVYSGAAVDLGDKVDGEFDLTLWHRDGAGAPATAELSFKYETEGGAVPGEVARRALHLFTALQLHLGDWASPERETKTSIALPCK
jgi:hypothetical protein